MKHLVFQSENKWQVDLVQNILLNEHIQSVPVRAAREYSQIFTGIGQAQIKLYVKDEDAERAQQLVTRYLNTSRLSLVSDDDPKDEELAPKIKNKNYFRDLFFFSAASFIFLPVFFNGIATYNFIKFLKQPSSTGKKVSALVVLILGWVGVAYEVYWLMNR